MEKHRDGIGLSLWKYEVIRENQGQHGIQTFPLHNVISKQFKQVIRIVEGNRNAYMCL